MGINVIYIYIYIYMHIYVKRKDEKTIKKKRVAQTLKRNKRKVITDVD